MADAKIEQKVLTTPTFINGSLEPAGAIVSVNVAAFKDEDGNPAEDSKMHNLADVGDAPVLVPAEIAAIGPTGPAPRAPQQKPAGTVETSQGFVSGGSTLIAEGHPEAQEMIDAAMSMNDGVEEEAVERLSTAPQGAGTSGSGTNGTETGALDEGEPVTGDAFVADTFIARTLAEITDEEIAGLSDEDKAAVIAAEKDREQPRVGLLSRLGVTE
jgi:hypothetical protein